MATTAARFSFKHVLAALPAGVPVSTRDLEEMGVRPYQSSYLARHGWLMHLGRGVYARPGDRLERDACLAFLARSIPGLHVGAKTALAWRGVRHNIAFRERIHLWGTTPVRLPAWFTERFNCHYQTTQLFDDALPTGFGLQPLPAGHPNVLVSVPERALLEMLSDVGKTQSLEEAQQLYESMPRLRDGVLKRLLEHTSRMKVLRLVERVAAPAGHPWTAFSRHRL
jgi:hypothetical protein